MTNKPVVEKPEGAYYFDKESQLWVTNGIHCKKHFNWWLSKHELTLTDENEDTLATQYYTNYLSK